MRKHLFWVLALAVTLGVAGVATAVKTDQKLVGKFKPNKVPKKKWANGLQFVKVSVAEPRDSQGLPPKARKVTIFFDKDQRFRPGSVPICKANLEGTTKEQAEQRCGRAKVSRDGRSKAVAALDVGSGTPLLADAQVTAFNGPKRNARVNGRRALRPTILLHSFVPVGAAGITTILRGTLLPASGKFGTRLVVPVEKLQNGRAAIKSFQAGIKKRGYAQARCKQRDKKWNYKGVFQYYPQQPSADRTVVKTRQPCRRR